MDKKRIAHVIFSLSLVICVSISTNVFGQDYPNKPIRIILPVSPGGVADVTARPIVQNVGQFLGQQFIVDYRPGATGAIGLNIAANSPADGYTLVWGSTNTLCMGPAYQGKSPPIKDFVAITPVIVFHNVLVVHPTLSVNNVTQLINLAKANPGKIGFASSGAGSVNHVAAGMFQHLSKTEVNHVPYKGGGPALTDVMSGYVEAMFATSPSAASHIKSGRLKALMVTSAKRVLAFPNIPSANDAGVPDLVVETWNGILAPAKTPQRIVNVLNATISKVANSTESTNRMVALAGQPFTLPPAEFDALIRNDYTKWAAVMKATGITSKK